jgi:hypothetical protein
MFFPRENISSVHIEGNLFLRPATRSWREVFKGAPLSDRAWALQERILAVRILHYGKDELFWECLTSSTRESVTVHHTGNMMSSTPGDPDFKRSFSRSLGPRPIADVLKDWYRIVSHYSSLSLARNTHKFPALSGLASRLHLQL